MKIFGVMLLKNAYRNVIAFDVQFVKEKPETLILSVAFALYFTYFVCLSSANAFALPRFALLIVEP